MVEVLRMPEVAANATEALLAHWLVAPNVPYSAGDALVTVETEKALVDVEADADGVILRTLVPEGEIVPVGTPIAIWGADGETKADVERLVSSLAGARQETISQGPQEMASQEEGTGSELVAPPVTRKFASPLARKMAAQCGVDLSTLTGTGPGGRIRRRDVEIHITVAGTGSGPSTKPPPGAFAVSAVAASQPMAQYVDVPASRMRQAIARRLTESKQSTPHFYLRGRARVDRLLEARREMNDGSQFQISVNDLVVLAVARSHVRVPAMNVQWMGKLIREFSAVDISIAVSTTTGLVTPVIRDVGSMTISAVAERTHDLIARARDMRIQPSEFEGGSISVTNLGMHGVEEFAAIINPPQAAILAVGATRRAPVVESDQIAIATVLDVTLSVDHRCVDGAVAADWLQTFIALLESPARLLA